jgi:hypothetical protein
MNFRSPTGKPIRLPLLSGHTAVVGAEPRELPEIFHLAAHTAGCVRDNDPPPPAEVPVTTGPNGPQSSGDHDEAYRSALTKMLEREEEGDFTADSLPNINAVSKLCGFRANKEAVLKVFRAMKDEAGATS